MLMSDYITPVMYIDISGYLWESFWINVENWWNTIPENSAYSTSNTFGQYTGPALLGLGLSGTAKHFSFVGKQTYWYAGNPAQVLSLAITVIGVALIVEYGSKWLYNEIGIE